MRWRNGLWLAGIAWSFSLPQAATAAFPAPGDLISQVTLDCSVRAPATGCPGSFVQGVRFLRPHRRAVNRFRCGGCLLTDARWSRDGRRLLVNGGTGVRVSAGGGLRLVPGTFGAEAVWGAGDSLVIRRRGGSLTRITRSGRVLGHSGTFPDLVAFDVSRTGDVAFEAERLAPTPVSTIWVARSNGTHARRLAKGLHPRWSPDGSRILFSRRTRHGNETLIIRRAGGRARRLVSSPSEVGATWSPHGTRVAFARCVGMRCEIRTVGLRGGPSRLFARGAESGFALDWRPGR